MQLSLAHHLGDDQRSRLSLQEGKRLMRINGQCHCGLIRYTAEIDPERVTICHCTDCQALTGTAFRVSVNAQREDLRIEGEPRVYEKRAESGAIRFQHFCANCGSPLFSSGEDDVVWGVRWGSIRQRDALVPTRQIWRRSAPDWVCHFGNAPAQERE